MKEETIEILKKYSQEKILQYLPYLTEKEQNVLEKQILHTDFKQLQDLYMSTKKTCEIEEKNIKHIPYTDKAKLLEERRKKLENSGASKIKEGKYAVITIAGGQGTRLGHSGPKGTYKLETVNGPKYLFEIIVDTLKRAQKKYEVTIPWYIMVSNENHEDTTKFLEEHKYFGYDKQKVKFFMQGELPLLDTSGNLILDKDKKIKSAADGNGGIYKALKNDGILQDLKNKGIEWIFVSGIDNILSNFVDPLLLGLTIEENHKIASKTVAKENPKERVGIFCKVNGKPQAIEYTELPQEMAEERDESGELVYAEVNILTHLFHITALEKFAEIKLPYHVAFKKSGYLNEEGKFIEATEPNAYKFEQFIFDTFSYYDDMTVLRVKREDEFAPVKNKEGNDSPETATKLYNKKWKERNR